MVTTTEGTYDGHVLRPDEPLVLAPNTRVRITIETVDAVATAPLSFLRTAKSLQLDGPSDWSANIDSYLYDGRTLADNKH